MKKKILLLCASLLLGANSFGADYTYLMTDLNMDNFWQKTGKPQEKVNSIATNILMKNKIDKRASIYVASKSIAQARSN